MRSPEGNFYSPEHEHIPDYEYFVLLDFDRCIGNTDALQGRLERIVAEGNYIDTEEMREAHDQTIVSGGSFDTVTWLRERLQQHHNENQWETIRQHFVEGPRSTAGDSPLMPDAQELLDYFEAQGIPYGFLTYGNFEWQTMKLQAAGQASAPQLITDQKEKGKLIRSWWSDTRQAFILPAEVSPTGEPVSVGHLTFLDDKAVSFKDAPAEHTTLIQVKDVDPSKTVPSQMGVVAEYVHSVHGLREAFATIADDGNRPA